MPVKPIAPLPLLGASAVVVSLLAGCRQPEPAPAAPPGEPPAPVAAGAITVLPLGDSPLFPGATIRLESPSELVVDPGTATFTWTVDAYELGMQTSDAASKDIANSAQGQYIQLILDNNSYSAHHEPQFDVELPPGSHVLLAFLSRSYHESVREPGAFVLRELVVGDGNRSFDLAAPHLFYGRPNGTYSGDDTKRLLLDFYLANTTLAPDGNTVRATVNGQVFTLDRWQPYVIAGLPLGDATIQLELIDAAGQPVPGPYNNVTRTVVLEAGGAPRGAH